MPELSSEVLRRSLVDHRRSVLVGAAGLMMYQLAEASVPIVLGLIVDHGLLSKSWWAPVLSVLALGVVIATVSFSWRTSYRSLQRANARNVHRMRRRLARRVIDERDVPSSLSRGEYATVLGEDTTAASDIIEVVPVTIACIVGVLASAGVLAYIDPVLGALVFGGTIALLVILNLLSRRVTNKGEQQQQLLATATARVVDLLAGLRPLAGFGGQLAALVGYRRLSQRARVQAQSLAKLTGGYEGISTGVSALLVGIVGVVAGWRAFEGHISVGELVTVVGLTQFVAEPLRQLSRMPRYASLARASARRVSLLDNELAKMDARTPEEFGAPNQAGGVGSEGENSAESVAALEISIDGRQYVAHVGELTTIDCDLDVAVAVVDALAEGPDASESDVSVRIYGVPAREWPVTSLRHTVLADSRHPAIFRSTVGETVSPGGHFSDRSPSDDSSVRALVVDMQLDDVIGGAEGLERSVADRGSDLSGGQRQRLTLARALHARPPILVLVDPLSAVDAATGAAVAEAVARHRRDQTTVILSAGRSLQALADRRH